MKGKSAETKFKNGPFAAREADKESASDWARWGQNYKGHKCWPFKYLMNAICRWPKTSWKEVVVDLAGFARNVYANGKSIIRHFSFHDSKINIFWFHIKGTVDVVACTVYNITHQCSAWDIIFSLKIDYFQPWILAQKQKREVVRITHLSSSLKKHFLHINDQIQF